MTSPIVKYDVHNDGELKGADVKKYRSLTMTAAYLSMDRYDIQHTAKELATEMKTPTNEGMVRLKRLARYLMEHLAWCKSSKGNRNIGG